MATHWRDRWDALRLQVVRKTQSLVIKLVINASSDQLTHLSLICLNTGWNLCDKRVFAVMDFNQIKSFKSSTACGFYFFCPIIKRMPWILCADLQEWVKHFASRYRWGGLQTTNSSEIT